MLSFVENISIRSVNFGFGRDWLRLVLGKMEPATTLSSAFRFPFQFNQWAPTSASEPETVLPQRGHHVVWRRFWLSVPGGGTRASGGGRLGYCWEGWGSQGASQRRLPIQHSSSAEHKPVLCTMAVQFVGLRNIYILLFECKPFCILCVLTHQLDDSRGRS